MKQIDKDIEWLLETVEDDKESEAGLMCADGEDVNVSARVYTIVRRLVREAGYALPEAGDAS